MASNRRVFQIAEKIRNLIAVELLHVADPRLSLVTITSVMISPDLRSGKVYWTVTGGEDRRKEVTEALDGAQGVFRKMLGKNLGIRYVPQLKFFYDDTLDTVDQVESLFRKIEAQDRQREIE